MNLPQTPLFPRNALALRPVVDALALAARQRWELIDGSPESAREVVLRQLERTAPRDVEWASYVPALRSDDFFLASAAASGARRATEALRREHEGTVVRALGVVRVGGDVADDVAARIWEKMLFGIEGRPAGIATYSGRGALGAWLHVSVIREAHLEGKQRARYVSDDSLESQFGAGGDAELEYMKGLYAERFRAAFRKALAALPIRQRNLLRYTYVDGLPADRLGALYGVHRVSIARWLADAREALAKETRGILARELGLAGGESESVLRLIQSRLDVSLSALALEG